MKKSKPSMHQKSNADRVSQQSKSMVIAGISLALVSAGLLTFVIKTKIF